MLKGGIFSCCHCESFIVIIIIHVVERRFSNPLLKLSFLCCRLARVCCWHKMLKLSNLLSRRFLSSSCVLSKNISNKDISSRLHDLLSNMPNQEEVQLKDVRKVRMEKRTKRFLVQPTNISWQVILIK